MDVNALLHRSSSPRDHPHPHAAPSAAISDARSYPATSLPHLRAPLPALPIRLPGLHPASTAGDARRPDMSGMAGMSGHPSTSAPPAQSHSPQSSSLAPLRFIIPSSHCAPSNSNGAYASASLVSENMTTVNIRPSTSVYVKAEGKLPARIVHRPTARVEIPTTTAVPAPIAAGSIMDDGENKKLSVRRNRVLKNPNRSTKSKARPGLRKGKWTEEEERYATQLTNYFKEGLLPIERGTMLRLYLSQKLNCEPMRITKKFTGGECIGKQVFRPCSPTPETRVRLMQAQLELVALEAAFIKKLKENREDVPGLTDGGGGSTIAQSMNMPMSSGLKKRRPRPNESRLGTALVSSEDAGSSDSSTDSEVAGHPAIYPPQEKRNGDSIDDASAVGLLLDFFYTASRNETDENESVSTVSRQSGTSHVSAEAVSDEPDAEVDVPDDRMSPARAHEDQLTSSPTKRMRTLSISACVDEDDSVKRSRLGSVTVMATN